MNVWQRLLLAYGRHGPWHRGKGRLVHSLARVLLRGHQEDVVPLRGIPARMRCRSDSFVEREILLFGEYEPSTARRWRQLADKAGVVIDVGANVGYYTLGAAAGHSGVCVHAFEPNHDMAARLRENLALNGIMNVVVNEAGVGPQTGSAVLARCRGDENCNDGMDYVVVGHDGGGGGVPIPMVCLDDYCSRNAIGAVSLLKIDVEGGEHGVLLGARRLLQERAIDCIVLELSEWSAKRSHTSTEAVKSLLHEAGFSLWRADGRRLCPVPPTGAEDGMEALALRRGGRAEEQLRAHLERCPEVLSRTTTP